MAHGTGRADADRGHDQAEAVTTSSRLPPVVLGERVAACLSVSRAVYSLRALLATAYKFSDRYAVLVDEDGNDRWAMFVVVASPVDLHGAVDELVRELGDQQLRATLEQDFGPMRTLIVAQAFAEGNLLDRGRDAADHNADPQGTGRRR